MEKVEKFIKSSFKVRANSALEAYDSVLKMKVEYVNIHVARCENEDGRYIVEIEKLNPEYKDTFMGVRIEYSPKAWTRCVKCS